MVNKNVLSCLLKDGRRSDCSMVVQVREKELHTVYIDGAGGTTTAPKSTRNVGILCKAAMRDVGVMYHCDDAAPMTRNIAVGVGEIGVLDEYELAERADSSTHITNMALQQLNMAAFQSRHLRFSNEQLREVLDLMLKKNLRSVAVQCRFATVDRAVSTAAAAAENRVTVACSDDTVDVDVLPVRQLRSAAVDCRPSVFHRAVGADFVYRVDSATNTRTQGIRVDRGSNTDSVVRYPAATNTDARLTGLTVSTTDTQLMTSESDVSQKTSGAGQLRTVTVTSEVRRTSSSSSAAAGGGGGGSDAGGGTGTSSELARQKKRDSMLFGDADEPPLIVAGGERYQTARSDTPLSTSSTSDVSGGSDVSGHLMTSGRTVSEPEFSQTAASSSRESFVCRSDEALMHLAGPDTRQTMVGQVLESSDGDGSVDTGSVVWRGDVGSVASHTDSTVTQSRTRDAGGGRQVFVTETTIERRRTGPEVTSTTSEGSLRSIMKSSSSSDKDSSSPAVIRRKITFIDGVEQRRWDLVTDVAVLGTCCAIISQTDVRFCHHCMNVLRLRFKLGLSCL